MKKKAWRYQRGKKKAYIDEGQIIQWWKGKQDKKTNTGLQNTTPKTKDWATRAPKINRGDFKYTGRETVPAPLNLL